MNALMETPAILEVPVDDGVIDVTVYGDSVESSVTILCLHGWTLDQRSFEFQRHLARPPFCLATFDRRGFGASPLEPNFTREVEDLHYISRALPGNVFVYGVSQGARLALRATALGRVAPAGLILQGGHLDGFTSEEQPAEIIPFDDYRAFLTSGNIDAFRQSWCRHPLVSAGFDGTTNVEPMSYVSHYRGMDLLAPDALPVSMDLREQVGALQIPVMTIVGTLETPSRKAHAAAIEELTGAQRLSVDGGGHLCHLSHPERVNPYLHAWCTEVSARVGDGVE